MFWRLIYLMNTSFVWLDLVCLADNLALHDLKRGTRSLQSGGGRLKGYSSWFYRRFDQHHAHPVEGRSRIRLVEFVRGRVAVAYSGIRTSPLYRKGNHVVCRGYDSALGIYDFHGYRNGVFTVGVQKVSIGSEPYGCRDPRGLYGRGGDSLSGTVSNRTESAWLIYDMVPLQTAELWHVLGTLTDAV